MITFPIICLYLSIISQGELYCYSQRNAILRRHLKDHKRIADMQELCGVTVAPAATPESSTHAEGDGIKVITGPNNTKIAVGSNIFDRKHPEDIKITEVHAGGIVPLSNISEEAYALMGNQLENTLVFDEKRNFTGKKALQCLVNMQNFGRNHSST